MVYEISTHWRNGECRERYAVHAEANPDEEFAEAVAAADLGESVVLYRDGAEIRRHRRPRSWGSVPLPRASKR